MLDLNLVTIASLKEQLPNLDWESKRIRDAIELNMIAIFEKEIEILEKSMKDEAFTKDDIIQSLFQKYINQRMISTALKIILDLEKVS